MSKVFVTDTYLTDIGNAIREKNGETMTYKPSEMAAAIQAISGGGDQPQLNAPTIKITEDTLTITANKNNGNFVTGYNVYVNPGTGYVLFGTTTTLTNDLTQYQVPPGDYSIKVTAVGENFIESDYSNELNYTNVFYSVTNTLTNCTSNNSTTSIRKGAAYSATITADSGYQMSGATVSITMGDTDITGTAYSDKTITIAAVTGNTVINITAPAITGPQWVETTNPPTYAFYQQLSPATDIIYATNIRGTASSTESNVIAKSSDGVSWENITVTDSALYDGYGGNEPFVFGDNGTVIYPSSAYYVFYSNTSNITSWTKVPVGIGNVYQILTSAFYGGGKFVLTYNGGTFSSKHKCMIFTSSNGKVWSKYEIPDTTYDTDLFGAYLNGTYYVFISGSGKVFYTSTDGTTWEKHTSAVAFPNTGATTINVIVRVPAIYADNKYVIKTRTGSVYSTNGIDWVETSTSTGSNDLRLIAYFNNMFVSTDSISEDGINWTSTGSEISIINLAVFNNKLVGTTGTKFYYATE